MSSLYDAQGQRKYMTEKERAAFLKAAASADREVRTFCETLAYTGCRISEALALTIDRVELEAGAITLESLKKRRSGVFRTIPVPFGYLDTLDMVHGLREAQRRPGRGQGIYLWTWSRTTAWRRVKAVLKAAGFEGTPWATPKGLRHAFGVLAVDKGQIPLPQVQRWMGHADLATTAIYTEAMGEEERNLASRMWSSAE